MRTLWERLLVGDRGVARRAVVSAIISIVGFSVSYAIYEMTGFYLSSVVIVTVILVSLYAGGKLAIVCAAFLSLAADYWFIPPVGGVLNSRAGWEHLAIVLATAIPAAFGASSVRRAFGETTRARQEAERAKRAAEEASTLMERMLALVAHDVRNPIATAKMAVTFRFDPVNEKQRSARAVMLRNLDQADAMIQTLLDIASVRAGRPIPLDFHDCDLREEVERMVESLGARDRVELVADEPIRGAWAEAGIARALQNLVANGVKYGAKDAKIVVHLRREDERAVLSVHNDGEPIPLEDRAEIFDAFRRTKQGVESGTKGWGLGLSIVRAVAEAHGGRVTLESEAEAGTTFTLALPIRAAAPSSPEISSARASAGRRASG